MLHTGLAPLLRSFAEFFPNLFGSLCIAANEPLQRLSSVELAGQNW